MNDHHIDRIAGDDARFVELTVRFQQHEDGTVEYWVFPQDRFGAETEAELARLWCEGACFALVGAHVLQRRLLEYDIVRALDEANGFVRRVNALARSRPVAAAEATESESDAVH